VAQAADRLVGVNNQQDGVRGQSHGRYGRRGASAQ
jgi:hypothetical protein